ncbi:HlyD family efflux transporter periplasmic adaptor subunit, partial [Planctomycetota bacterium]
VVALQADLDDKRNKLRIAEEVAAEGLVSKQEVFSKQRAVEAQRAKVLKAENGVKESYAVLLSKEKENESKMQEISLKNRSAEQKALEATQKLNTIEKELIDLQTKRGELDRMEIRAPRSGFIQTWFGVTGSDTVKEGDQLFVIVPEAKVLAVEMKVSGNDMPLIHAVRRLAGRTIRWLAIGSRWDVWWQGKSRLSHRRWQRQLPDFGQFRTVHRVRFEMAGRAVFTSGRTCEWLGAAEASPAWIRNMAAAKRFSANRCG